MINLLQGAFVNLTGLKPLILKNASPNDFSIASGAMDFFLHLVLCCCFEYIPSVCYELPVFHPNDYLYKNYSHFGETKNVMSEILAKGCSFIKRDDISFDNKLEYISIVHGEKIKKT